MSNVSSSNGLEKYPRLRFPQFTEALHFHPFSDFAVVNPKTGKLPDEFYYIDLGCVNSGELDCPQKVKALNAPSRAQRLLQIDDVLFQTVRPYQQNNYYFNSEWDIPVVASTGYAIFRTNQCPKYLYQLIHTKRFLSDVLKRCTGTSFPAVSGSDIEELSIWTHSIAEQEKIGNFLWLIDEKIRKQHALIRTLKKYKRGVIYNIFVSQNPMIKCSMSCIPMSELLTEYRVRDTTSLRVCSVAVNKGVVDQIEHLGRSFSASDTSHYGRVKFGDVIYTKSPTGDFPYGIVKQSKLHEDVAVSPLYGVYTPTSYATGNLIHAYFEQHQYANNYIRTLAQKGAKNTINITNQRFLEKSLYFPTEEKDREFLSHYLDEINRKISIEEKALELLQMQKRAFLSQLFI